MIQSMMFGASCCVRRERPSSSPPSSSSPIFQATMGHYGYGDSDDRTSPPADAYHAWQLEGWLVSLLIHPKFAKFIRQELLSLLNDDDDDDDDNNDYDDSRSSSQMINDQIILSHLLKVDMKNIESRRKVVKNVMHKHQKQIIQILQESLLQGIEALQEQQAKYYHSNNSSTSASTSSSTTCTKKNGGSYSGGDRPDSRYGHNNSNHNCNHNHNIDKWYDQAQEMKNDDETRGDDGEKNNKYHDSNEMEEIRSKFDGNPTLTFDSLNAYFGGLERIIGTPSTNIHKAMELEHTDKPDSDLSFQPPNYSTVTSSREEWQKLMSSPKEMKMIYQLMKQKNDLLDKDDHPNLLKEEILALRLYTGPMYRKYNTVVRGLRSTSLRDLKLFVDLCGNETARLVLEEEEEKKKKNSDYNIHQDEILKNCNCYTTTLHAINSGIIKLSKLTVAKKVYRGLSGRALPPTFLQPNAFNVMGGVELGFMSTTTEKDIALQYSGRKVKKNKNIGVDHGVRIIIKKQQGMVDRGADLHWLSQHPDENEILFSPLTGIEVIRMRMDGSLVLIEVRLSTNLISPTIEQILGKRLKLLQQLYDDIITEMNAASSSVTSRQTGSRPPLAFNTRATSSNIDLSGDRYKPHENFEPQKLAFKPFIFELDVQNQGILKHDLNWYNKDNNFIDSFEALLDSKANVMKSDQSLMKLVNKQIGLLKDDMNGNWSRSKRHLLAVSKREKLLDGSISYFSDSLLVDAGRYRIFDFVQALLNYGFTKGINLTDKVGESIIGHTARAGEANLVETLLQLGADVDATNADSTPLIYASRYGHSDTIEKILQYGANVDASNKDGYTPIMFASRYGHLDAVEKLLQRNPDVNVTKADGYTALIYASRYGHTEIVERLLQHNADVYASLGDGKTALIFASVTGRSKVVETLLQHNADNIEAICDNGSRALMKASMWGHIGVVEILLQYNPDVNASDNEGWTALSHASKNGHRSIVRKLLGSNADINMTTKDGKTAFHIASEEGFIDIASMLEDHNKSLAANPVYA